MLKLYTCCAEREKESIGSSSVRYCFVVLLKWAIFGIKYAETINSWVWESPQYHVCVCDFITFMNFVFLTHTQMRIWMWMWAPHMIIILVKNEMFVYLERLSTEIHNLYLHTNTLTHMTNDGAIKWFCALNCTVLFINNNFKYVIIYSLHVCSSVFSAFAKGMIHTLTIFLLSPLSFSSELTIIAIQNSPYMNKLWVIWCGWPQWDVRQIGRQNWCDNRKPHTRRLSTLLFIWYKFVACFKRVEK